MTLVAAALVGMVLGVLAGSRMAGLRGDAAATAREEPGRMSRGPAESLPDEGAGLHAVAFDHVPMAVLLFGADGREQYRNRAADEMLAVRVSGPLVAAGVRDILVEASGSRGDASETTLDLYGPPKRSLRLTARRFDSDQSARSADGTIVVVSDVTDQRRIDSVRRDFVANVSHELKTPVAALGLLAEAIADECDPATAQRLAGRLQGESLRLANTIDDLLALSEVESDQLTFVRVTAAEIRAGVESRSAAVAEQRGVGITWRIEPPDLWLEGDRRQLVSAVGNVVDNAIKYSEADSAVSVTFGNETAGSPAAPEIVITITDEGIGIPEADRERIFERFYRVDPARSRSTGGTGLGLSIVRHVMLNHRGSVTVESAEGVGTTFVLRIPCSVAEGDAPPNQGRLQLEEAGQ